MSRRRCDVAKGWQLGRQEPATPVAEGIRRFHNDRLMVIRRVTGLVTWVRVRSVRRFANGGKPSRVVHGTRIEVVWTRMPAVRLGGIAIPSFTLLYSVDERVEPGRTVKVVGHQWYWTYEYAEREEGREFESYRLPEEERGKGQRRRLEVDKRRVRPVETQRRLIVTAGDVLHSWAVPAFGVKVDACPGRLNQVARYVTRPGLYYGQCSEICGVNHGFMPIVVEVKTVRGYRKGREELMG
jgi:heme/copper-type cytochrome/quinol oxidase subunit 2